LYTYWWETQTNDGTTDPVLDGISQQAQTSREKKQEQGITGLRNRGMHNYGS
jgi:hypothetical protein